LGPEEQRGLAERWLRQLGREVAPAAVDQVAPHLRTKGKPDQAEVQAFVGLLRLGQAPIAAAVAGEAAARGRTARACSGCACP